MPELFSINILSGETLRGWHWPADNPEANLVLLTGMGEYAKRYEDFALWLNDQGIDVRVLDAFGQGENIVDEAGLGIWPVDGFAKMVDALKVLCDEAAGNGCPVFAMGQGMGSFMVQSFLERYPGSAAGVILSGTNGGEYVKMRGANLLTGIRIREEDRDKAAPEFGKYVLGTLYASVKDRRSDFDWLSYNTENVDSFLSDPLCGFPQTGGFWIEYTKGMTTIWHPRMLGKISPDENILIIGGSDDPVGRNGDGPRWLEKMYKRLGVKNVKMYIYAHMRHEILKEDAKVTVYLDILNYIRSSLK